jgi:recombination protein RecA
MPASLPVRTLQPPATTVLRSAALGSTALRSVALRSVIEQQLAQRIPAALTPSARLHTDYLPTGIAALDQRSGGLPVGAITEVTGLPGSGRTALAMATSTAATRAGHVVAWVDVTDALDPESAAATGIDLERLLWVRCGHQQSRTHAPASAGPAEDFQAPPTTRVQHGGGSPHPRSEERGLSEAVGTLLAASSSFPRDRITATPGAPNRPLTKSSEPRHKLSARIEQAGTDRQPSRRGDYVLRQRELFANGRNAERRQGSAAPLARMQPARPWQRIDQALRVTDLLLQTGGFRLIVLDLADIAAEFVSRIPMATWFRFRAGAEHAHTTLLVLTRHASTGSSAALLLRAQQQGEPEETSYFAGLEFAIEVGRQRFAAPESTLLPMRKPPQPVSTTAWQARTHWGGPHGHNAQGVAR